MSNSPKKPYTREQEEFLIETYKKVGLKQTLDIAETMPEFAGRSRHALQCKISKLRYCNFVERYRPRAKFKTTTYLEKRTYLQLCKISSATGLTASELLRLAAKDWLDRNGC